MYIPKYRDFRVLTATALCFAALLLCSCATNKLKEESEAPVTLEILRNAIGKKLDGVEVSSIRKAAAVKPDILTFDDKKSVYFIWKSLGIELLFEDMRLRTVFLYSEINKKHSAYRGNLPNGLIFSDKRSDVERKIGAPNYIGGANVVDVWVAYEKLKLGMTYRTRDLNDMDAGIDHLSIQ